LIPTHFFITSGKAVSHVSELNAFDLALKEAKIEHCNLVNVSSIVPVDCVEIKKFKVPSGSIIFCVLARMDGTEGMTISAGIAHSQTLPHGLVAEHHGNSGRKQTKEILEWKINEMAKIRKIDLNTIKYRIESLRVPMDNYGCAVVAFVFTGILEKG